MRQDNAMSALGAEHKVAPITPMRVADYACPGRPVRPAPALRALRLGPVGAQAVCADVSVVVDVLSLSTSVCVADELSLHAALLAAKMAGHSHINVDGTLIYTDRCRIGALCQNAGTTGSRSRR